MAREYRYELREAPEARTDGTKGVGHDIAAVYREEGEVNGWVEVPEHHVAGLGIPGDEMITALSSGTTQQKVQAYKTLIRTALDAGGFLDPYDKGWEEAKLNGFMVNNDTSHEAATLANEFILQVKPTGYPIYFELGG